MADREDDFISKVNTAKNRYSKERRLRIDRDDIGSPEQLIQEILVNLGKTKAHLLEVSESLTRAHNLKSHIDEDTH